MGWPRRVWQGDAMMGTCVSLLMLCSCCPSTGVRLQELCDTLQGVSV